MKIDSRLVYSCSTLKSLAQVGVDEGTFEGDTVLENDDDVFGMGMDVVWILEGEGVGFRFWRAPPKITLFSRGLKLPKLTITTLRRRRTTGASGATMAGSVAGSYASALADVAKSNNTLEETQSDIEKIEQLFSNSDVYNFFNPTVPIETKRSFVNA